MIRFASCKSWTIFLSLFVLMFAVIPYAAAVVIYPVPVTFYNSFFNNATFNNNATFLTTATFNGSTSGTVVIQAPAVAGTSVLTFPTGTQTLATLNGTETLNNKTLNAPTFTGGSAFSPVSLTVDSLGANNCPYAINAASGGYVAYCLQASEGTGSFPGGNGLLLFPPTSAELTPPASDEIVTKTAIQSLTNKTLGGQTSMTGTLVWSGAGGAGTFQPAYTNAGTLQSGQHWVYASGNLVAGSLTITFSGAAAFTNNTTYKCVASNGTSTNGWFLTQVNATTVTITGTGTDGFNLMCLGT